MTRSAGSRGLSTLLVAALLASCASRSSCGRRPRVGGKTDAAAVVVVDEPGETLAGALPLAPASPEVEPNDDPAHAQVVTSGTSVTGTLGIDPADLDHYVLPAAGDEGPRPIRVELFAAPPAPWALRLDLLDGDGNLLVRASSVVAAAGTPAPPEDRPHAVLSDVLADSATRRLVRVSLVRPEPEGKKSKGAKKAPKKSPKKGSEAADDRGPEQASPGDPKQGPGGPVAYRIAFLDLDPSDAPSASEPNGSRQSASSLRMAIEERGFFGHPEDVDWIQVAPDGGLPDGGTLRIELSPVEGVSPTLRVWDGDRMVARARGAAGKELRLRNVPVAQSPRPSGGRDQWFELRARDGSNVTQGWRLRVEGDSSLQGVEHEPNDHTRDVNPLRRDAAGTLLFEGSVAGFLWPGDRDTFLLTDRPPSDPASGAASERGSRARVDLSCPEDVDLTLTIVDVKGKVLLSSNDGGPGEPEAIPTVSLGVDRYARVTARRGDTAFDAPYHLEWRVTGADPSGEREPNNRTSHAHLLQPDQAAIGYLSPRGDQDWYEIVAPAGVSVLEVSVESDSLPERALQISVPDSWAGVLAPPVPKPRRKGRRSRTSLRPVGQHGSRAVEPNKRYRFVVSDPAGKHSDSRATYQVTAHFTR